MDRSTGDLVERMLRGDRSSFDDVVAWYAADVLQLGRALLWDDEEAKDVAQEALYRLVRTVKEGRFRSINGSIKGFLLTTARNLCIDRLRRRPSFLEAAPGDSGEIADANTPSPSLETEWSRVEEEFMRALSQLTDMQRAVLVLFEMEGARYEEISTSLDIPISKVKSDLFRARQKLRQLLEPYREML